MASISWKPTDAWVRRLLVPVVVFLAMASDRGYLADFWHHLARGRAMVEAGELVNRDQFTFTVLHQPFQDVNWLSQLLYYGLFCVGGLDLVRVVNALVLAVAMALLVEYSRRLSGSLLYSCLVGAAVFVGIWHVLSIRPQTFSLFLFVLLLDLLERSDRRPSLLILAPLMLALWTNLHGAFPAGLMLIGCFFLAAVFSGWRERRAVWLGLTLLASTLATLVNPYGWGIYLYVRTTSGRSVARGIEEWLPPSWEPMVGKAFFVSLPILLVLGLLAWRKGYRPPLRDILLLVCFLLLACTSVRMVVWWFLVLGPIVTQMIAQLRPQGFEEKQRESQPTIAAGLTVVALSLAAIFSVPGLEGYNPLLALRRQPHIEEDLEIVHSRLLEHHQAGRIFCKLEWGEYLSWSYWPAFTIFMDGRIEIYPDDVWDQYGTITKGVDGWQEILDDYQVNVLILDAEFHAQTGLLAAVDASARWRRQGQAGDVLLYLRAD